MIQLGIFISAAALATTLLHAMLIVGMLASGRVKEAWYKRFVPSYTKSLHEAIHFVYCYRVSAVVRVAGDATVFDIARGLCL